MDKKELREGKHVLKGIKDLEKIHPHKLFTFLFLFGISLVYSYLLISLTIETVLSKAIIAVVQFPKFYIVASFLILASMFIPIGLKKAFNEENLLKEYGIEYILIPVSYPDSYNPKTLKKFAEVLNNYEGKVLIHCKGAGRVRSFFIAYLIEYQNYTFEDAMNFGKQMDYQFMLENLLDREVKWQFKE